MNRLEAWLEGKHAGYFERKDDGTVSFVYDSDTPDVLISLSLPRDRDHTRRAAARYLENLLPDRKGARARMAEAYGVSSVDTFDLLSRAGGDVAGGLVLLPEGEAYDRRRADFITANGRDVARRISGIKQDSDGWVPDDIPARFSLAGTQGKFALAYVEGDWYWPNAGVPSTHIFKPARPEMHQLEELESDTLNLARAAGVPAPQASVFRANGQTSFMIERFDRVASDSGIARRLHTEDIAQSRGTDPSKKYGVTALQVVETLSKQDASGDLARSFVRQLAFNIFVANADAHGKNYSLLLRPGKVELAPLYDSVPVVLYPDFDQRLAMRISGAKFPQELTPHHWKKFARESKLDEDMVMDAVGEVARNVIQHSSTGWQQVSSESRGELRKIVERNANATLGTPSAKSFGFSPSASSGGAPKRAKTTPGTNSGSFAPKHNSKPEGSL